MDQQSNRKLPGAARTRGAGVACVALALAACAAAPREPVIERLDESTGTTVTVIDPVMELVATEVRGRNADPFAYLAPFETNRMGARVNYLWVSVPSEGLIGAPRLLGDGEPLELAVARLDAQSTGLSRAPYSSPAPWNAQFYFALDPAALERLARSRELALLASYHRAGEQRFVARDLPPARLVEFARRTADAGDREDHP